jgi:hypothetical protein
VSHVGSLDCNTFDFDMTAQERANIFSDDDEDLVSLYNQHPSFLDLFQQCLLHKEYLH